jgi:hypothetical protein
MTEEEIEVVAEELAKVGGTSWYPGREPGTLMKLVTDRYRDRARAAIAALDRVRAGREVSCVQDNAADGTHGIDENPQPLSGGDVRPGATVIYRAPGDRRAYPFRVVEIRGDQAYLAPISKTCTGWVSVETLVPVSTNKVSGND